MNSKLTGVGGGADDDDAVKKSIAIFSCSACRERVNERVKEY